jgi:hypothetical protein
LTGRCGLGYQQRGVQIEAGLSVHDDERGRVRPVAFHNRDGYRLVVARVDGQTPHSADGSETGGERPGPFHIKNLNLAF